MFRSGQRFQNQKQCVMGYSVVESSLRSAAMPKTLSMPRDTLARTATAPDRGAQRAAIILFLLAYLAILGVLFAPKGFFLAQSQPAAIAAPAEE